MCALAFAPSGGFALSAAEGERLVAVWATPGRQASKKKGGAVAAASLAVEQPVVGLATAGEAGQGAAGTPTCDNSQHYCLPMGWRLLY